MTNLYQKRKAAEKRFRLYGIAAVAIALAILAVLLGSLALQGLRGFQEARLKLTINDFSGIATEQAAAVPVVEYRNALRDGLLYATSGATKKDAPALLELISIAAPIELRDYVARGTAEQGNFTFTVATDDVVTRYIKGQLTGDSLRQHLRPFQQQVIDQWKEKGLVYLSFDTGFFANGDSREPEVAGMLASILGSVFTILVCLALAFPLGVATAVYLEEFAPKNWVSDLIEVNINNLAAVPSIVFGLLGLALYLNFFGLPRSSALVGGLTLALLVLPILIIATRAALRAVPPSIRDAARGMGASELQVVMHHVLPLAFPGIMTGTILSVARALGETAPLLMIGMVAFIADVPKSIVDPATAMPVQIYLWASSPEVSFMEKTAAAILVLLVILLTINLTAVWLRRKFERRW